MLGGGAEDEAVADLLPGAEDTPAPSAGAVQPEPAASGILAELHASTLEPAAPAPGGPLSAAVRRVLGRSRGAAPR